jgi:hypothetical protein
MMNEPKPFASLGPTLLARKGGARPAMRPQVQPFTGFERQSALAVEDLGWNDLGHDDEPRTADVLALTPSPASPEAEVAPAEVPVVRLQQEEIARKVAAPVAEPVAHAPVATAERRSALNDGRRAAFTLRVDAERHLKLRLACTIRNLSAQQLVTEALDRLLSDIPDLELLAARVQRG